MYWPHLSSSSALPWWLTTVFSQGSAEVVRSHLWQLWQRLCDHGTTCLPRGPCACWKFHTSSTCKLENTRIFFFSVIYVNFLSMSCCPVRHLTVSLLCCLDPKVACGWRRSSGASLTSLKRRYKWLLPLCCPFLMAVVNLVCFFMQAQHFCYMYQPGITLSEPEASVGRATLARKQSEAVQLTV